MVAASLEPLCNDLHAVAAGGGATGAGAVIPTLNAAHRAACDDVRMRRCSNTLSKTLCNLGCSTVNARMLGAPRVSTSISMLPAVWMRKRK